MPNGKRRFLQGAAALGLALPALVRAHGNDGHAKKGPVAKEQKDWGIAGDAKAVKRSIDIRPCAAASVLWLAAAALPLAARAEIIDITWGEQGRFERRMTVAPGKFAEACGKLAKGSAVAWRFGADAPLNFNIHYHVGKDVHYPERREALASASGQLQVQRDQDYCWMWTNKSAQPVTLQFRLQR